MDAAQFDGLVRHVVHGRSRRSLLGGALATVLLTAIGRGAGVAAKPGMHAERCTPAGRRCGSKKADPSCKTCCHRYFITTPKGKKTCACKPAGTACGNAAQCCTGQCQKGLCQAGQQNAALSEAGSGIVTPTSENCDPSTTSCEQILSGDITSGTPIAAGTFAGPITVSNFTPVGADAAIGDVSGPITLAESATGEQLVVALRGRVTVSFLPGTFTFNGGYTITGGTGRFTGASGAGSATFSGSSDPMTGATTITSLTLSGVIIG